jgi:hypothetical protein
LRAVTTWLWAPTCICCSCWRRDIAVCRNAATLAVDLAYPVLKQSFDETEVINFNVGTSF